MLYSLNEDESLKRLLLFKQAHGQQMLIYLGMTDVLWIFVMAGPYGLLMTGRYDGDHRAFEIWKPSSK